MGYSYRRTLEKLEVLMTSMICILDVRPLSDALSINTLKKPFDSTWSSLLLFHLYIQLLV